MVYLPTYVCATGLVAEIHNLLNLKSLFAICRFDWEKALNNSALGFKRLQRSRVKDLKRIAFKRIAFKRIANLRLLNRDGRQDDT